MTNNCGQQTNCGGCGSGNTCLNNICCATNKVCGAAPNQTCCTASQSCSFGVCCPTGQTNCNGTCRNLNTDPNNCGACGNRCRPGVPCVNGVCTTQTCSPACSGANPDCCGTTCTNLRTDRRNCGTCGNVCNSDRVCENGACVVPGICTEQNCPFSECKFCNGNRCLERCPIRECFNGACNNGRNGRRRRDRR